MNVDAVQLLRIPEWSGVEKTAAPAGGDLPFGTLLARSVENLNTAQVKAGREIQAFLEGRGPNVHSLMLDIEKANLALELGVQVRNKLLDAYNEIMRMQV
jgi:flagellar hook-basal body complex protein FliE